VVEECLGENEAAAELSKHSKLSKQFVADKLRSMTARVLRIRVSHVRKEHQTKEPREDQGGETRPTRKESQGQGISA